jgi:hypothetical protein
VLKSSAAVSENAGRRDPIREARTTHTRAATLPLVVERGLCLRPELFARPNRRASVVVRIEVVTVAVLVPDVDLDVRFREGMLHKLKHWILGAAGSQDEAHRRRDRYEQEKTEVDHLPSCKHFPALVLQQQHREHADQEYPERGHQTQGDDVRVRTGEIAVIHDQQYCHHDAANYVQAVSPLTDHPGGGVHHALYAHTATLKQKVLSRVSCRRLECPRRVPLHSRTVQVEPPYTVHRTAVQVVWSYRRTVLRTIPIDSTCTIVLSYGVLVRYSVLVASFCCPAHT